MLLVDDEAESILKLFREKRDEIAVELEIPVLDDECKYILISLSIPLRSLKLESTVTWWRIVYTYDVVADLERHCSPPLSCPVPHCLFASYNAIYNPAPAQLKQRDNKDFLDWK